MKKKLIALSLLIVGVGSITPLALDGNTLVTINKDKQNNNMNNTSYSNQNYVDNIFYLNNEDTKKIWRNGNHSFNNDLPIKIIVNEDIDFSWFTVDDSLFLPKTGTHYNFTIEIDGQGHRFYGKPNDLIFTPLFANATFDKGIYFHDLVLDGMGTIFDTIASVIVTGYSDFSGLLFENITIENNTIQNQEVNFSSNKEFDDFNNDNSGYSLSLFINKVYLKNSENLSEINFSNITITNNLIKNNNLTFQSDKKRNDVSVSWLTSFYVETDYNDEDFHYEGQIDEENIIIENNSFFGNNIFVNGQNSSETNVSFGNLNGSLYSEGVKKSDSPFIRGIKIYNISIQNNLIEKPKNINEGNFFYSELISNPNDISDDLEEATFNMVWNVFGINNVIFNKYNESLTISEQKNQLYNQYNKAVFNLNGSMMVFRNLHNVFFISPNDQSVNNLEIIPKIKTNGIKDDVGSLNILEINNKEIIKKVNKVPKTQYGIYGFADMLYKNSKDELKNVLNYETNFNENVGVVYDFSINRAKNIRATFKYVQKNANKNQKQPYILNDLSLLQEGKVIGTSEETLTTTEDDNFTYRVNFKMKDNISIKNIDFDNLRMSFKYHNISENNANDDSNIKLISAQGKSIGYNPPAPKPQPHDGGMKTWEIVIISVSIILILSLLLLLFLLLVRKNRNKVVIEEEILNSDVQDWYYEFYQNTPINTNYEFYQNTPININYKEDNDFY